MDGFCGCDGGDVDGDSQFDNCDEDEGTMTAQYLKLKFSWLSKLGSFVAKGSFPVGVMSDAAADVFDPTGGIKVTLFAETVDGVSIDHTTVFTSTQCKVTRTGKHVCKLPSRAGTAAFKPIWNEDKTEIVSFDYKVKLKEVNIPTVTQAPVVLGFDTRGIDRKISVPSCVPKGRRSLLCL